MPFVPCDGCTDGLVRLWRVKPGGGWVRREETCPKCLGTQQMKRTDREPPGAIYVHRDTDHLSTEEIYEQYGPE